MCTSCMCTYVHVHGCSCARRGPRVHDLRPVHAHAYARVYTRVREYLRVYLRACACVPTCMCMCAGEQVQAICMCMCMCMCAGEQVQAVLLAPIGSGGQLARHAYGYTDESGVASFNLSVGSQSRSPHHMHVHVPCAALPCSCTHMHAPTC